MVDEHGSMSDHKSRLATVSFPLSAPTSGTILNDERHTFELFGMGLY